MKRVLRPIWGFGPWGWVLLPVVAALAYCAAGGYDLRHAIIRLCYDRFGYDWVFDVIMRNILFGSYWSSLAGTTCGPITLLPILLAMHLAPRRWAWWQWASVSVWLLFNPYLCFEIARRIPLWLARAMGWSGPPPSRVFYAGQVLGLTLLSIAALALLTWRIPGPALSRAGASRSTWRFAALWLFATSVLLATLSWWMNRLRPTGTAFTMAHFVAVSCVWQASVAIFVIGPALAARRRAIAEPWWCDVCGYDLRGLASPTTACPECGRTTPAAVL